jgi:hypothetical protein
MAEGEGQVGPVQGLLPVFQVVAAARAWINHGGIEPAPGGFQSAAQPITQALLRGNRGAAPAGSGDIVKNLIETGKLGRSQAFGVISGAGHALEDGGPQGGAAAGGARRRACH